ncbi:MAG: HAMP domain-containing histidine kinase [Elusimicrobia bacterium]|nr:HAMP domain-containing histidine kinase [Elusimicrobiota bacterium]
MDAGTEESTKLRSLRAELAHVQQARRLQERMVAEVAHELRNGLSLIDCVVRQATGGSLDQSGVPPAKLFELSRQGVRRMTRLVSELLELSCLRCGHLAFRLERVDLAPILERIAAGLALQAGGRPVSARLSLAPELRSAYVDPDLFEGLVSNLADNARRFARSRVEIRAAPEPADPMMLRVTVEDDGPGVPHHVVATAIRGVEPLVRPSSESHVTTLGLSLSREIAERLGGRLWYERKRHLTRFHVNVQRYLEARAAALADVA